MASPWPLVRSGRIHDASDPTFQAHSGLVVIVKLPEPPAKENEVGDEFAATAHLSVLGDVMDVVDDDPHADTRTQTRARERRLAAHGRHSATEVPMPRRTASGASDQSLFGDQP